MYKNKNTNCNRFESSDNLTVFEKSNSYHYINQYKTGINEDLIRQISKDKNEPKWMLDIRLQAFNDFLNMEMPKFGPNLNKLNLESIYYFAKKDNTHREEKDSNNLPDDIKNTFDSFGVFSAEKKFLDGNSLQYESESIYHNLKKNLSDLGVIFTDMDTAIQKHEKIVKKYFMKCIDKKDHKFSALHYAIWSGGTFLYIAKGVKIKKPLQAYFRMNAENMGQFEHSLIIVDEESEASYIEGCSAPKHSSNSLHAGAVEIFVKDNANFQYISIENWSKNTYNLNTKRAIVNKNAKMNWLGGNMGSNTTMLYPCSILKGENSSASHLGLAFASQDQNQDTGAKVFHLAKNTKSKIIIKSLAKNNGKSVYRGNVFISKNAENSISHIECDTLLLSDESKSDTIPKMEIKNNNSSINHEARTGKLNEENIRYLMSRGIKEKDAENMIINGFINPILKSLPLEYAIEMNRLIEMEINNEFK